ncbi:nicotinamidase [Sulfuricella sp. T08]|uniref:isochorismatase family protein n=1 Tax=Sulfuricella sp. T08 TaxID=1632857 RepID=UPI0006179F4B|nr:isochorismatase family protein [Sulfuricella sp. T08]GAO37513.1 nicotinamidase [Sulfuricella sp. T08]
MNDAPTTLQALPGDALLLVDVQNDFLPGGSLAVLSGDHILPALTRCISLFRKAGLPIYASRDWHPADHCSFRGQGGPWPPHCIVGSHGAAFSDQLALPDDATIISKATRPDADAYSAFAATSLERRLRDAGIKRLFVGGLATDYCVLNTVRDALSLGFTVMLLLDGIRAVDVKPGDGQHALAEMIALGTQLIYSENIRP